MKYWEKPFGKAKPKAVEGEIHIVDDRCKGCSFCVEFCPNDVLELSTHYNIKGYHPPRVVAPDRCTYDGLCESMCPDAAIFIIRREVKDDQK